MSFVIIEKSFQRHEEILDLPVLKTATATVPVTYLPKSTTMHAIRSLLPFYRFDSIDDSTRSTRTCA